MSDGERLGGLGPKMWTVLLGAALVAGLLAINHGRVSEVGFGPVTIRTVDARESASPPPQPQKPMVSAAPTLEPLVEAKQALAVEPASGKRIVEQGAPPSPPAAPPVSEPRRARSCAACQLAALQGKIVEALMHYSACLDEGERMRCRSVVAQKAPRLARFSINNGHCRAARGILNAALQIGVAPSRLPSAGECVESSSR